MLKKLKEILTSIPATIVGGIFLILSFVFSKLSMGFPIDPAWITVLICGLPLLYNAIRKLVCNRGISKISSALLISIAMAAAIAIGDLFAAGEVAFIMAIGVGISSVRGDKNAASDSFGLVALSSVGPILAVLLLGCFYRTKEGAYAAADITEVNTVRDVVHAFAVELPHYAEEVFISVIPIVAVFVIFQIISRRYQRRQKLRVAVGFGYTYIGLVLFLCGVNVGFAPVGTIFGNELAGSDEKWLLIPIGSLIGYFIVKAEPAIQILNHQIQTVTNGVVSAQAMNRCLSIGVSVSVGLAMLRIITGISIQWIIIPGYIIALIMSKFVPKIFVGIAFDSGGVASGPMTSTFLLPLCIGVCEMLGGNVMTDAFGVVALVALTPLIAVQIMGLAYRYRMAKIQSAVAEDVISVADDDDIIEIEEA